MIDIQLTFESKGVMVNWDAFMHAVSDAETLGRIMKEAASMIIVPNITKRFLGQRIEPGMPPPTQWSRSRYREDPVGPQSDIASQPFADTGREESYVQTVMSPNFVGQPVKTPYSVMLGIGNVELLNKAVQIQQAKGGGKHHYLWMILEAGTGVYTTDFNYGDTMSASNKQPIIRYGYQVFFDREAESPTQWTVVHANKTVNPGQVGRHFFFNMEGLWYDSDKEVGGWIYNYINRQVQKFSFRN